MTKETHIEKIKAKTEAALQTTLFLAKNPEFCNIELEAIWTLVDTSIIPIITYGSETWTLTKREEEKINNILINTLKRITQMPTSTANECILVETGYKNITDMIEKKKVNYIYKILNYKKESLMYKYLINNDDKWTKEAKQLITKY